MGQSQSNEQTFSTKQSEKKTTIESKKPPVKSQQKTSTIGTKTPPSTPILNSNLSSKVDSTKLANQLAKQKTNRDMIDASNIIKSVYRSYLVRKEFTNQQKSSDIIKSVYKSYLVRKEFTNQQQSSNIIKSVYRSRLVRKSFLQKQEAANIIKSYLTSYQQKKK